MQAFQPHWKLCGIWKLDVIWHNGILSWLKKIKNSWFTYKRKKEQHQNKQTNKQNPQ